MKKNVLTMIIFLFCIGLLLVPAGQAQAVEVTVTVDGDAMPGGVVTLTAEVDEGTIQSIRWSQIGGVAATITPIDASPTDVTLGDEDAYKEELFHVLAEPPIGPDQLPPNVPVPEGEFAGGLQNRFQVQGMSPFSLEEAALVTFLVEVTTTEGDAEAEVEIHTMLPWKPASDARSVPIERTVLLHGKDQESYEWSLDSPSGSAADLSDPMSQNPDFTPDIVGMYEVTVMDDETGDPVTLEIYAGTWRGIIEGQDSDGRPIASASCTGCHSGTVADWAQTGHAEIFTNNLDTSTHYGENCFSCHTVGFDPDAANNGIDDAPDYQDFLDAGYINNPGDNWTAMLAAYPESAKMGNIQCENCHGPQTAGHMQSDEAISGLNARSSISSDVCATCHGEPLRHARYQQWQLSGHANYELAIEEGERFGCAKCHTGNGFLAWADLDFDLDADAEVTWTADTTHPQTCATCHDPHKIGTTSGNISNATVRVAGDTPLLMSGFVASDVGRGAICMICHNAHRGLRNDDQPTPDDPERAPHGPPQADILMGQNAYFMDLGEPAEGTDYPPGRPGAHASLEDSCATCHMQFTPPPDDLAYKSGGTNHTFYASEDICIECHTFTADDVLGSVETNLEALSTLIEEYWYGVIKELAQKPVKVKGQKKQPEKAVIIGDVVIASDNVDDIDKIIFGSTRGRQGITVIFDDGTEVGPIGLNSIDVVEVVTICQKGKTKTVKPKQANKKLAKEGTELGACPGDDDGPTLGTIVDFAPSALLKAGWNYLLVHNDGSHGAHNPSFANSVLASAIKGLADDVATVQTPPVN
jgi:hypothetical protein